MPIIDDTTPNLGFPMPNGENYLQEDVLRLRAALLALDTSIKGALDAIAALPTDGEVGTAVAAGVAGLVDGAPAALNTLNKLAAAIGDDENFSNTMTLALAGKLPNVMASPTVLGGIKIGSGLVISGAGVVSVPTAEDGVFTFDDNYFTATAAQTSFEVPGGYIAGQIEVFLNGVLLFTEDYTATDGTNVVLTEAAVEDDRLLVRAWAQFVSADYCKADGTGATGTWGISITGNAATATTAATATSAVSASSAGTALDGFGVGQAWVNVTSSRAPSTPYQNTTGKPILVNVGISHDHSLAIYVSPVLDVPGVSVLVSLWEPLTPQPGDAIGYVTLNAVVPPGHFCIATTTAPSFGFWSELR